MKAFERSIVPGEDAFADVAEALQTVRKHLDMDWSVLTEFADEGVIVRVMNARDGEPPIPPGQVLPHDYTYCRQVADGDLPNLIPDTSALPETANIPATTDLQVRSQISIPINKSNGDVYGMFCCMARTPHTTLNERDVEVMRLFANLAAKSLNSQLDKDTALHAMRKQLDHVIAHEQLEIHFQPIVSLRSGAVRAVEALSRIAPGVEARDLSEGNVQWWFDQARETQMQIPFELNAVAKALTYLQYLPEHVYCSVNVSPATLSSRKLRQMLEQVPPNRVFVELTEHAEIAETAALLNQLEWLQSRRIGIGIDDVGAGYSGLSTILKLRPQVIKLDRTLVDGIDQDPVKQSLVRAMLEFSTQQKAFMIAEGVETVGEHLTLHEMGVRLGQGFGYCHPRPAFEMIDDIKNGSGCYLP